MLPAQSTWLGHCVIEDSGLDGTAIIFLQRAIHDTGEGLSMAVEHDACVEPPCSKAVYVAIARSQTSIYKGRIPHSTMH